MIRSLALALLALGLASGALAQPAKGGGLRAHGFSEAELAAITPTSPNPFLAFLAAGVEPDVEYWTAKTAIEGARRARSRAARGFRSAPSATYRERERAVFNRNDGAAEPIPPEAFGDAADEPIVRIAGVFETRAPAQAVRQTVTTEDYATGALAPWSIRLGADNEEASTVATARIGDGSFGATSGDVDVYDLVVPTAGTYASIEVRTPASDLDPVMALYGPDGQFLLVADDVGDVRDPSAGFFFEAPGTYRLYVWGWTSGVRAPGLRLMADASTGYGVGSTGAYELAVESTTPDTDAYSVELKAGDVLAVATAYPTEDVAIFGPDGKLLMRSRDDISGLYPEDGPLLSPAELGAYYGGISVAAVATRPGTYTIEARGQGEYAMVIQGARPGHERPGARGVETIFVDFDGGTYYPSRDIEGTADTTYLSPLRDFLPRWGLAAADESAVVDAFMSTLRRVLRDALRQDVPGMAGLDVVLLNSRDHADPGPGVNRLVVAGTAEQIGAEGFIGQASSVDVGNFRQDDIAYVLLDGRSAPPDDPNSINQFTVAAPRTKAELVGHSMAAVAAHEAGHFFGLHHTENDNDVRNIQDAGPGTMWHSLDIGSDGVFGPGDGGDVRFRDDAYYRFHPFSGTLNAADALAYSLHTAEPAASGGTASGGLAAERFSPAAIAAVIAAGGSTSGRVLARESFASDPDRRLGAGQRLRNEPGRERRAPDPGPRGQDDPRERRRRLLGGRQATSRCGWTSGTRAAATRTAPGSTSAGPTRPTTSPSSTPLARVGLGSTGIRGRTGAPSRSGSAPTPRGPTTGTRSNSSWSARARSSSSTAAWCRPPRSPPSRGRAPSAASSSTGAATPRWSTSSTTTPSSPSATRAASARSGPPRPARPPAAPRQRRRRPLAAPRATRQRPARSACAA